MYVGIMVYQHHFAHVQALQSIIYCDNTVPVIYTYENGWLSRFILFFPNKFWLIFGHTIYKTNVQAEIEMHIRLSFDSDTSSVMYTNPISIWLTAQPPSFFIMKSE